jgi:hypothetical protein
VAERWVGSCRREMLDHVIPLNEQHLRRLGRDYLTYSAEDRRIHFGDSLQYRPRLRNTYAEWPAGSCFLPMRERRSRPSCSLSPRIVSIVYFFMRTPNDCDVWALDRCDAFANFAPGRLAKAHAYAFLAAPTNSFSHLPISFRSEMMRLVT